MKKTLFALTLALLTITSFAEIISIPNGNGLFTGAKKDCLIIDMEIMRLKGTPVKDEDGSTHIHLDFVPYRTTKVIYFYVKGRFAYSYEAKVSERGAIGGSDAGRNAVVVMNTFEGGTDGYIAFNVSVGAIDEYTPSLTCYLSGKTENEWNEEEQRFFIKSGSGVVSGGSYSTTWSAWADLKSALPLSMNAQSKIAPVWGTFRVRHAMLTDKEIVDTVKK